MTLDEFNATKPTNQDIADMICRMADSLSLPDYVYDEKNWDAILGMFGNKFKHEDFYDDKDATIAFNNGNADSMFVHGMTTWKLKEGVLSRWKS